MGEDLLALRAITKGFPGVQALKSVDFSLKKGEIHALLGENGAGKSTLIKVITGVVAPDGGEIVLDGQRVHPSSPSHAASLGISTVYQEVNLAPNLSIAENVCLGREPKQIGLIDWKAVRNRAESALKRLGLDLDVTRPLSSVPVAIQQMTAIARVLDISCQVLILDEPTSSLDSGEVEQLFAAMRNLRSQGISIIFITHFLDQVFEIADRVTVLRNGSLVATQATNTLNHSSLVELMIGRSVAGAAKAPAPLTSPDSIALFAAQAVATKAGISALSFSVAPGEALGFAGLLGSGRTESAKLVFGLDGKKTGTIEVDGKEIRAWDHRQAIRKGFGYCPEDRKAEGIVPELSVRENMMLVLQGKLGIWRPLSRRRQAKIAENIVQRLRIATPDLETPIGRLSGGNQQKALLVRWLAANPQLLILDEPTRGIDIGAKEEIANYVDELRETGVGFVFISSELAEIVRSCTKAAVMRNRKLASHLTYDDLNEDTLMKAIAEEGAS